MRLRQIVELAQQRPLVIGKRQLGGTAERGLPGAGADFLDAGSELLEDVVDGLGGFGAARLIALHTGSRSLTDRKPKGLRAPSPRIPSAPLPLVANVPQ